MVTLDREFEAGELGIQLQQDGERIVVRAWGEVDLSSAKELEARLRRAIEDSRSGVILDLGGVTFIDAACLRVLLSVMALSRARRRELVVLRESEQVRYVIETSGVKDLLPLAD